jgi:RNAse (barnase) inhibitor barstar|tara:strand:- start:105 stop:992 length:888 start_codon:yes stop_codon:yes gene_type:complete
LFGYKEVGNNLKQMNIKFSIFISHDTQDETIAIELKSFLEDIFLNANVYVSGRDLEGGQTWIENIKLSLKTSQVVISIISKKSITNNWIYFETGAGFVEDKSIPLICDGISFQDLFPPISLLQSRTLTKQGIEALVQDISNKLSLRKPKNLTSLDKLLSEVEKFLKIRNIEEKNTEIKKRTNFSKVKKVNTEVDEEVQGKLKLTRARQLDLMIKKILSHKNEKDIPVEKELLQYSQQDVTDCMKALNIKEPDVNLSLMIVEIDKPKKNDKKWKKINALKNIEGANNTLDKYEKTI